MWGPSLPDMSKKTIPAEPDFWAQAHFNEIQRRSLTPHDDQLMTSVRARDFWRVIHNVIKPLLNDLDEAGVKGAWEQLGVYTKMCDVLHDIHTKGDPQEHAEYPPDGGKQLVADRLDTIEAILRKVAASVTSIEISTPHQNICVDFRPREERRA